jgi:hypothetical protein
MENKKSWESVFVRVSLSSAVVKSFLAIILGWWWNSWSTKREAQHVAHMKRTPGIPGHVLNEGVGSCKTFTCGVRLTI